jgi:nucleotide-binding universal stress UspA family protein
MFQRILVPLDGSEGAKRAIPVAARIARTSGASIVFIRVVPAPANVGTFGVGVHETVAVQPEVEATEKDLADAASYLEEIKTAYAGELAGLNTEIDVATGATSPTIFLAARDEYVDLIVMCSHGETGLKRWVLGSVAHEAVRHSPVPVLVLNEHEMVPFATEASHPLRVLVALDGSALAETALEPAAQLIAALAPPAQSEVHLLRVVDLPSAYGKLKSQAYISDSMQEEARQEAEKYVKVVTDRLREGPFAAFKLNITSSVAVSTDVAGTIIKQAEKARGAKPSACFDMIAIATHGRGGLRRLVMGSVTEHILGATRLPLLIVRPREVETTDEKSGETAQVEVKRGRDTNMGRAAVRREPVSDATVNYVLSIVSEEGYTPG